MEFTSILIIDNERGIRQLVEAVFTRWPEEEKYNVFSAASGEQGLEQARKCYPDIILLDYNMPGMNGYEVLCRLRLLGYRMPVIALTGEKPGGPATRFLAECDASVPKPFEIAFLYQTVLRVRMESSPCGSL